MINTRKIAAAALVALMSLTACTSSMERTGSAAGEVAANDAVSVLVMNNNYNDVNVYAVRGGERIRLGTVTGNSSSTLTMDRAIYGVNDVSLVAIPIGGFGAARSGRLSLTAGDTVEFRIMQVLDQSNVFVRPPS
jgi:hypothetical protein